MATNVENIISRQKQLAEEIARLLRNFRKDGAERKTQDYVSKKLKDLEIFWGEFTSLHERLVEIIPEDHPYFTEKLHDKTYDLYKTTVELMSNYRRTDIEAQPKPTSEPQPSTSTCVTPAVTSTKTASTFSTSSSNPSILRYIQEPPNPAISNQTIPENPWSLPAYQALDANRFTNFPKLPPIKIPKFSGDYKEWKSFIDIFTNVIHRNPCISNVEKMQYLLCHLEGDARRVIAHLQLNSNNYETALRLIQERFNNNRKIITTYVNTIMDAKTTGYRSQEDIIMLYDIIRECLEALKNLKCNTDDWGPMIVCIAMRKLDAESLRLFEESLNNPREMPSIDELLMFLDKRHQVLDCIKNSKPKNDSFMRNSKKAFHTTLKRSCAICNKDHYMYQCQEFKKMNTNERIEFVAQKKLCPNCLAHNKADKCKSGKTCVICNKKHHTLLHRNNEYTGHLSGALNNRSTANHTEKISQRHEEMGEKFLSCNLNKQKLPNVLLPTAMVRIKNIYGQIEQFRALIDPGSQISLITEETVQILKLQKQRIRATITGVGEFESAKTHSKVNFKIQLRNKEGSYLFVEALVLPKLNSLLPETLITAVDTTKYGDIILADPTFNRPGPIDILLGADVYANIITEGVKEGHPAAQNTKLGWILFGNIPNASRETNKLSSFLTLAEIEQNLNKLWELEDYPHASNKQTEEICDLHFKVTHDRDSQGRYIVRLPFKENVGQLGHSRNKAIARFIQIENKLKHKPEDLAEYNKFLAEYLALGHMSIARPYNGDPSQVYYLPHHAVFKATSTTTRLRVVFDASSKSESGLSLNDLLHCGPKIQNDLYQILLRWRKHRYVYTADIEKMFRQIKIAEEDRNFQRILWRQKPTEPIQEFILNTVTYGTGPASYLSVRTLQQLAEDEGKQLPIAKKVLTTDFYIDDMLTGADTKSDALRLQTQIISLLNKGGFNLRKWTSNDEELLKNIPEEIIEKGLLEIKEGDTIKTLGIHWNPIRDEFQFKLKFEKDNSILTKRSLLSKIATIFDPLGWLSPVTLIAKLMMQELWKTGTEWDHQPPQEITNAWNKFETELLELEAIKIPRWITHRVDNEIQLHGFCDASEKAYAAVIYSRTTDSFGQTHTTLLTAKSKVAPLNQRLTLPRLELCGAVLLAKLLNSTITTLEIKSPKVFAWCDSEIVLAWIAKNPSGLPPIFVANRVSDIHKLAPQAIWTHVSSQDNPADPASRGINPKKLITHNRWWRGPLWLSQPPEAWPAKKFQIKPNEEIKRAVHNTNTTEPTTTIFNCSNFTRQTRVIAYCSRFINNCKLRKGQRYFGFLTSEELKKATHCILKIVQQEVFRDEVNILKKGKTLKKTSKLLSLHPFLDADGILRVGGRIHSSNLPTHSKHQILLPQKHHITNLIIDHAHQQTLHGGTQLTLNYIRSRYWIINGKSTVQSRNHRCITCVRHSQSAPQQLMGNLPMVGITPSPPFSHCGVDYAGPFLTKMSKGRGTKTLKGYIALFICMVTKAVHLELVSDLTTDAFLAAYKRFVARRGNCKEIYSDNGTNFVGASNKMDKDLQLAISKSSKHAAEITANDGTEWKFIPAASPHFGGLWEAGVKSVKGHLKRILGETLLTYEEFTTVLYQVEACLNSRPIGQQSSDPRDLEPLTPGHFLIGRPLLAPPEPDISNDQVHQRWKLVTKLHQDIWKRWSQEYLSLLQQRSKWQTKNENPKIDELVLLKDDNLPPQKWPLGRIVELHPGEDGIVRIVSVKYKNGIKKRPLNKLCQLPTNIQGPEDDTNNVKAVNMVSISLKPKNSKANVRKRVHTSNIQHDPVLWSKSEHFDRITPNVNETISDASSDRLVKRKRARIAPCTWAAKLLHSTLLILFWLATVFAQDYEVLQPKSGYYIENLGNAQIKRGSLRLQISFPIAEILEDQRMIDLTWTQIKEMCERTKRLTDITHCNVLFQHMSTKRQNLLENTAEIMQRVEHNSRRRRGILGSLLTTIFGVNDEVYTDIEVLQQNQQNLLHTTSQQVLLLNSKINQSNYIVEEKLKQFDLRLSRVIGSINEMANWYTKADHNRISIEVISTYISAEGYYDELQEKYDRWLSVIHGHGNILDFTTVHDITKAIEKTTEKIGSHLFVARKPQDRLDIKAENDSLKLYGYLNIVENSIYELVHVTPMPHVTGNNSYIVTILKHPTLAINYNEQTYFNLEEQDFNSCARSGEHLYLCKPTIIYSIEESPSCVVDEIYNRHSKASCKMQEIQLTGTIWKALMMKNTWLYVTMKPKVVAVVCKGTRKELLLNSTGIIRIHDDCYIKTKEITLKTSLDEKLDVIASHIKETIPAKAAMNFSRPPTILQGGVLIRPNEQLLDYSLTPDTPHIKTFTRSLAIHSAITTSSILITFILATCIYKYRHKIIKRFASYNTTPASPQGKNSASDITIQQHFDRVLSSTSPAPQHVHT